jgi:predicted tellurium resistance membrane protein TerC
MTDPSNIIAASTFVSSAFLVSLGLIIIVCGLLIINNLIMKFWKPMGIIDYLHTAIVGQRDPKSELDKQEPR